MFNIRPVHRTAAGWVKQLDDGTILGPVETKQLAEKLEAPVATPEVAAKPEKKSTASAQK